MSKQPGQIPYLSEVPLGLGNLYVSIFIADGQYPLDLVNVTFGSIFGIILDS